MNRNAVLIFVILAVGVLLYAATHMVGGDETSGSNTTSRGVPIVSDIVIPELTEREQAGKQAFEASCSACHGINAAGVEGAGPPLVHIIYEPSHHGDGAFVVAVRNGVRSHHWPFGDMPVIEGVADKAITEIIAYVRKLQRANGIN